MISHRKVSAETSGTSSPDAQGHLVIKPQEGECAGEWGIPPYTGEGKRAPGTYRPGISPGMVKDQDAQTVLERKPSQDLWIRILARWRRTPPHMISS
ncbi:hypothetical protein GCM10010234_66630 [Streptomyces hawaiiensis]